jgi:multiple sugar transport system ATP-binding protein
LLGVILKNIYKKYGDLNAVKEVSFECQKGQFICLLGPSGAGKTSILKMIAGVEEVTSGEIYIDNVLVNDVQPQDRDVAMMFENYALYPHFTVFKNLQSPYTSAMRRTKYSSQEVEKIVREVAKFLSIEEFLDRYPKELSGGQKQRVALGRALVRKPSIFLLDEPIAHLDAKLRHNMLTEFKKIHEEAGGTFIYATPDQLEAMSLADVIVVINKGEIHQIGTPKDIFLNPKDEFVAGFTGDPPMNLFNCVFQKDKGSLLLAGGGIELMLSKELTKKLVNALLSEEIRAGIRPMDISITSEKRDEYSVPVKIHIIEPLGRFAIVTAGVNQMLFKIKVRGYLNIKEDQLVWLNFDENKLHFFDCNNSLALKLEQ